jgi:hypothetical protein
MVPSVSVRARAHPARLAIAFRICGPSVVAAVVGATSLAQTPPPAPQVAQVAQVTRDNQLTVWAGYGDSDNIGRTSIPEEGSYRSLGLFLALLRQTARLDAEINSDLEYRSYADDLIDEESVGTLDASALIDVVEDRFAWSFAGNMNQGQQDPFAARGPGNRETVKTISTGPRLDVPFGRTSLMASATRSANRYEESGQVDNDGDFYELTLARQARPTTVFALGATSSETEFVDGVAPSYQIDQLFLRVNKTLRRGTLNADVGTNEVGSDTQSRRDPLLNLAWNRSVGARSTLTATAQQGFTNTADTATLGAALVTVDPFEQKTAGIDYGFAGESTSVTLGLNAGEEDYAGGSTLDNDFRSANFEINYRASARLNIGVRYERWKRESQDNTLPSQSMEDRTSGVWLNRTFGRRFSVALDVSRYESIAVESVDETRTELRFAYSPTGDTASALRSVGR